MVLLASHCHSLKERRSVATRLKDRIRSRFDVSVCEVGGADTWQRVELGVSFVSGQRDAALSRIHKITAFVEDSGEAESYASEYEVLYFKPGELEGEPDDLDQWQRTFEGDDS